MTNYSEVIHYIAAGWRRAADYSGEIHH
ncbi:hypothetical protein PAT3040_05489, partial [Paenibacillus agaridevorans]